MAIYGSFIYLYIYIYIYIYVKEHDPKAHPLVDE